MQSKNIFNCWADLSSDDEIAETKLNTAIDSGFIEVRNKKTKKEKGKNITEEIPFSAGISIVSKVSSDASETYKYTKLCNSVIVGEACKWLDKCTYAHKVEQLRLSPCHFGLKCNNIVAPVSESDIYINNPKGSKVCTFIHPDERLDEYSARVFKLKKPLEVTPVKKVAEKIPEAPKKVVNKWAIAAPFVPKLMIEEIEKVEEAQEKIILDVPEKMAMAMLEMAIKSGKTNIEVRIH